MCNVINVLAILLIWMCFSSAKPYDFNIAVLLPVYSRNLTEIPVQLRGGIEPSWPFFLQMAMPAIRMAQERVSQTMPDLNLTIKADNSYCSSTETQFKSVELRYAFEADVFFGPCCEYSVSPVVRFLNFWNVPLVTAGAMAQGFDKNLVSSNRLLTRLQGGYTKAAEFVTMIFRRYDWEHVVLIYEDGSFAEEVRDCYFCMGAIHKKAKQLNVSLGDAQNFRSAGFDFYPMLVDKVIPVSRSTYHA